MKIKAAVCFIVIAITGGVIYLRPHSMDGSKVLVGRPTVDEIAPSQALSLKAFQKEIQADLQLRGELSEDQRHLHGLNRIEGFIFGEHRETVLFGRHDPTIPDIELDDLLVALRNAYQAGKEFEGTPGVTIDPMPDVPDPWRVQLARVLGMPPTAPMGIRQLKYDYDLKRVSAGLLHLPQKTADIQGTFELARSQSTPCNSSASKAGKTATHRFWFTSLIDRSGPRYSNDENSVWIDKPLNVQLLSEEEFLQNGRRVGGSASQPAAAEFTRAITKALAGNEVEDYLRLRNDFRIIEVAKVMRFKNVPTESLAYLVQGCPLRAMPAVKELGGVRRSTTDEAVCEVHVQGGRVTREVVGRSRQEFRGGVEISMPVEPADFTTPNDLRLSTLRKRILRSRPSAESVIWTIS